MIRKEILNEILRQKSFEKQSAELESENKKKLAMENEDFALLETKKRAIIFELGQLKFENKDTKKLETELEKVNQEQQKILTKLGIESFVPKYNCSLCDDTGFVNGKICKCVNQRYFDSLMQKSKIDFDDVSNLSEYKTDLFENKAEMELLKEKLNEFVDIFETSSIKNLVFCGKTGVGKTYLSKSLAKTLIEKGYPCLFVSAFNLNNEFLQVHTSKQENKLLELEKLISPELLIIDDLGTEPVLKNVTIEYLLMLITERINLGKKTVITTNLLPNDIIDRYQERLFSRLFDKKNSFCFNFQGKDLRLTK